MSHCFRTLSRLTLAFVALSLSAGRVLAQVKPDTLTPVTMSGIVTDATGRGIPDVEVSIPILTKVMKTDSTGRFQFVDIPPRVYYVRARRIGLRPIDARYPAMSRGRIRIVMVPTDVTLDTVVVREKCQTRGLAGFVCRENAAGGGAFLDAVAIDSTKAEMIGDIFLDRKAFRVTVNPRNGLKYPTLKEKMCLVTLVDGLPAGPTNPLPIYARQLLGVEIYDKPMDAPKPYEQYTWKGREPCALIVYWTGRSR